MSRRSGRQTKPSEKLLASLSLKEEPVVDGRKRKREDPGTADEEERALMSLDVAALHQSMDGTPALKKLRRVLGRPASLLHTPTFVDSSEADPPLYALLREWALGGLRGALPVEKMIFDVDMERAEDREQWVTVQPRRRPSRSRLDLVQLEQALTSQARGQDEADVANLLKGHLGRAREVRNRARTEWAKVQKALDTRAWDPAQ